MLKKILVGTSLMFLCLLSISAQAPSIIISLETEHFLFGQTTWAKYVISNPTKTPIYIGGIQEKSGYFSLLQWEAKAFYPDGKEVPQHSGGEMVIGTRPTPKKMLGNGEQVTWSQPVPVTDVKIDKLPAGEYTLIFYLKYSLKEEPGVFEKETQASATFHIDNPAGADAAWLQYVANAKKALLKEHPERTALSQPLGWGDVINCGFCPHGYDIRPELLQKYPTSTYAAYVLAKKIPDYSNPLFKPVTPSLQVKMARDEGRTVISFEDKDFESYFQKLDAAGKAGNIPQPIRSSFYCFYGDLLVQRGRFNEAERAFKMAIEPEPQTNGKEKVYYERAKQFLEALQSNGEKEVK